MSKTREELNFTTVHSMSKKINGRTIKSVDFESESIDNFLVFEFTDGTSLWINYDYLYDYELRGSEDTAVSDRCLV